jgi:hypothetical protein
MAPAGPAGVEGAGGQHRAHRPGGVGQVAERDAVQRGPPGGGGHQAEEHAQRGGLARPVRAQETQHRSAVGGEGQILHRGHVAVPLGQPGHFYDRHRPFLSTCSLVCQQPGTLGAVGEYGRRPAVGFSWAAGGVARCSGCPGGRTPSGGGACGTLAAAAPAVRGSSSCRRHGTGEPRGQRRCPTAGVRPGSSCRGTPSTVAVPTVAACHSTLSPCAGCCPGWSTAP